MKVADIKFGIYKILCLNPKSFRNWDGFDGLSIIEVFNYFFKKKETIKINILELIKITQYY